MGSSKITGIAASSGVAIAKAFILQNPDFKIETRHIEDASREVDRLATAVEQSKTELEAIKVRAATELGEDKAAIFAAHLLVLADPEFVGAVKSKVTDEKVNAEAALEAISNQFITIFESMDNEYMKERAADVRDVTKRIMSHLLGISFASPATISEEVVIIADDLTPSDTAQLNKKYVQGFVTNMGGRTSHSAIMSRSLEIPAVVGTQHITESVQNGTMIIVDGLDGDVIIDPTPEERSMYEQKQKKYEEQKAEWHKLASQRTVTANDAHVELGANIGNPEDLDGVLANGAEAIGLYRTEFLYMGRDQMPTEDEQFEAYKKVLEAMGDKPVVIRTLDIGGDKELPYLEMPEELNPFLGFRAIRLCLENQDIFRIQLRALLRASVYGNLKIMFPMVATLDELREAKAILAEEKDKLQKAAIDVSETIEVGMMVEIPSTAVLADRFAKEVDFFSIGTNDLIQYTLAADRMNERVAYLYQPYHPAILRLVNMVIQAAHKEGKWVGMCGEMAGDPIAIPLLLGLGLDEFSMSASSILPARSQIKGLTTTETKAIAEHALYLDTANDVEAYVKEQLK
ncbi:phosphotransferase system enzyme I (PtsI) [Pullulanibacillus pueri]|uniref:Phosphoenolpyruvate-protein phosphotransferase n=1 Tax=Pullulanibacillus pueri TaxID=1437324 RepID=A0A8J2ZZ31_9BACL|nr:phosphoenolpyruvate--protein phosphotransferase [Pullulanibacillus pueri]MBM7683214.1 phosphotransferase system enzyme I (PtsI) [Pullulanibacillus pueri]GGH85555.1 phosphoenolpyruvate-protein phosphotransferase [Pullulanibacillus pueri]